MLFLCICIQDWLVEALRERMKYFRRNRTVERPQTEKKEKVQINPTRHQMPHVSALPMITDSAGEDQASHDRHIKILSLEWKKKKTNKHAIAELMRRTFMERRQRILSSPISMDNLLAMYPPLQHYGEVSITPLLMFVLAMMFFF